MYTMYVVVFRIFNDIAHSNEVTAVVRESIYIHAHTYNVMTVYIHTCMYMYEYSHE